MNKLFFTAIIILFLGLLTLTAPNLVTSAYGQTQTPVTVTTDKLSYSDGDTVIVTGEVQSILGNHALNLILKAPNGNIITIKQLTVDSDKKFSTELTVGGSLMKSEGPYTILVQYGSQNRTAETNFTFDLKKIIKVEGSDKTIGYKITNGNLVGVVPDLDATSLNVAIVPTDAGSVTLTIPRDVLDSKFKDKDARFFVLIDGEGVDFDETKTDSDRTLTIQFPASADEIEIIGTFVVPEFGTIAVMILAVAIISIIAVSAKSRLSIMPKY